jgi:hypothetical protein
MKTLILIQSDDATPQPRAPMVLHFLSKTAANRVQSADFCPKMSLITAFNTTYRPVFAHEKIPQTTQIKSLTDNVTFPLLSWPQF